MHRISVGAGLRRTDGVSGGVLTINKDELASLLLQDDRLSAVAVDVAQLKMRIMPVRTPSSPAASWKARAKSSRLDRRCGKRWRRQNAVLGGRATTGRGWPRKAS
ncbi:MAG: glycine/sarcosine/betaine reductase component B subunit [Bilophila wadsworthia]